MKTKVATMSFQYSDEVSEKLTNFMNQQVLELKAGDWSGNPEPGLTVILGDNLTMTNVRYIVSIEHGDILDDMSQVDKLNGLTDLTITVKYRQYVSNE